MPFNLQFQLGLSLAQDEVQYLILLLTSICAYRAQCLRTEALQEALALAIVVYWRRYEQYNTNINDCYVQCALAATFSGGGTINYY